MATNESDSPAPIGLGAHPYVLAGPIGEAAVDDWTLHSSAREVILVSHDRLLPVASVDVAAHDSGGLDFRSPRRVGATVLNHAFTGLAPDEEGLFCLTLTGADGYRVEVSWPADAPWVQLYTADHQPGADRRHALAIEPMTCPPDSFNSGRDLRTLAPGETTSLAWRLRVL
jgi:aldose 1-epimerase